MRAHSELEHNPQDSLKSSEHFSHLSPAAVKDFDAMAISASYPGGAVLFMEKQDVRGIFLVISGSVKLSVSSSCGKTLILRIAKPGEILGLMSALSGSPYEVTAEVLHACRVAFVPRRQFLEYVAKHPEAYRGVVNQLGALYSGVCEQLRTVGLSNTVPEKVARLLLDLSSGGRPGQGGAKFTLPLTHEEIAEFIGSSRESVTRTLSDFRGRAFIHLHGATMTIANRPALESMAGA